MTTPGGVSNLPLGALTLETLSSNLQDMTSAAMKSRAVERFPTIFNSSTGLDPSLEFTPFGVLTSIWASVNSLIANADPADIQGPEDLPELVVDFIEGLPLVGQYVNLIEAILGTYDGTDTALLTIQTLFAPIREVAQFYGTILSDNLDGTLTGLLDALFTDNGDGTWAFIEDGIHTLIDNGDGTFMSPVTALQNLLGQLGTYQSMVQRQQAIIDNLFNAVNYTDLYGVQLEQILDALRNIPFLNVLGVGGPTDIGGSILEFLNQLISGWVDTPGGTGATFPDAYNIGNLISSWASLGRDSFDILGIRNNKSLFNGFLSTSQSNMSMDSLAFNKVSGTPTAPTVPVTQSTALTAWHRVQEAIDIGVVSWTGYGVTNITSFFVNIWKMVESTGDISILHHSADQVGLLSGTIQDNIYSLPSTVSAAPGDLLGFELHPIGSGTHNVVGDVTWRNFSHPSVVPRRWSSKRNAGTSTASPSPIADASVDYATTNVPFIEFGINSGIVPLPHSPEIVQFNTTGATSIPIPSWANTVQVIALGCSGGGAGGSTAFGIDGAPGAPGSYATATWVRGTHFTGSPSVSISIGFPGFGGGVYAAGGAGDNCTASITGQPTVTGARGAGGSGLAAHYGPSPGNQVVDGITYVGGLQQNTVGGAGNAPGGAGAGGGYFQAGGQGAVGSVWLRFKQ